MRACIECGSERDTVWREIEDGSLLRHERVCFDRQACLTRQANASGVWETSTEHDALQGVIPLEGDVTQGALL